jgi:hypothetical protein
MAQRAGEMTADASAIDKGDGAWSGALGSGRMLTPRMAIDAAGVEKFHGG